jgi:2'-5' RNA ligase
MIRLFVAVALPDALRQRLAMLCRGVKGARWVDEDSMHLTLRFIGEVEEPQGEEIADALDRLRAPGFPLTLLGAGHFETRGRVRALWVGIEPNPALTQLQERIESAVQRTGLPPEGRKFSPHITLARLDRAQPDIIRNWLHENSLFRAEPFAVEEFVLFQSLLGNGGAVYRPVAEFPLDGAGDG